MKNRKYLISLVLLSITFNPVFAFEYNDGPILSLKALEEEMLTQSTELKSMNFEVNAAVEKREALPSNYIPKLTLDGSYKYLTEVPEINMAPGRTLKFGDNTNYTIGPTLSMTLIDFNSKSQMQASLDKSISSKKNDQKSFKNNLLYKARVHYLNLVFLLEKRALVDESLKVALKQLSDVSAKKKFGVASKLDYLTAQKEVHELESQFKEIDFNVLAEKSELYNVTFSEKLKIQKNLKLENFTQLAIRFISFENTRTDAKSHSRVQALIDKAKSLEDQSLSIKNQRYPKVNLFARTSYDYPNGPTLEQFNQNAVGITLSMPLFDGGEINHSSTEKIYQAEALKQLALTEENKINESTELLVSRIYNLKEQDAIFQKKAIETNEIAGLIYKSFQEGRSTFIEVERANVKSREAKLSMSSNKYQIILNLIQLAALAGE